MSDDNKTTEDNKPEEAAPKAAQPEAKPEEAVAKVDAEEKPEETEAPAKTKAPSEKAPAEATSDDKKDETPAEEAPEETPEEAKVEEIPKQEIKPGMLIRVHEAIKDTNSKGEERERVQMFEGTVLGLNGEGISRTMTVRKISGGIGVEKIYPLASPHVQKIEVVKQYRVRRSKLWYLRRDKKKRKMYEDTRKRVV